MNHQLDLRDLNYFETIAETGHLGRAAKKLFRTQPALTGCIRRLEEIVGVRLFERVGRGMRLSPAGEALLVHARRLRLDCEGAVREMDLLRTGLAGQVRIGAVPTAGRFLLPGACREFLQEAPGVTIKSLIAHNNVLRTGLKNGDLDLVVTFNSPSERDFLTRDLLKDEVVVVARSSHPIFDRPATLEHLLEHKWVLAGAGTDTREWLERTFIDRGLRTPEVQLETNLVLLLPPLIESSDLLSFISRQHLADQHDSLREVELPETTMTRRFVVTHLRDSYLPAAALRFLEVLQGKGRELFADGG